MLSDGRPWHSLQATDSIDSMHYTHLPYKSAFSAYPMLGRGLSGHRRARARVRAAGGSGGSKCDRVFAVALVSVAGIGLCLVDSCQDVCGLIGVCWWTEGVHTQF